MEKRIGYFLILGILSLNLTACHIKTDLPVKDGPDMETAVPGSSGLEADTGAGGPRASDRHDAAAGQHDAAADHETEAGSPDMKLETTGREKKEEIQGLGANYILPDSAVRLYDREELEEMSPEQIRLARNEIYARHGRRFQDPALQTYFESRTWYRGTVDPPEFDDGLLNQTEHDNLSLLLCLEQETEGKAQGNENGTDFLINTAYADIVNENHAKRKLHLSTEDMFWDIKNCSQVIDHGTYFEVTGCRIVADTSYDAGVTDGKGAGDTLQLGDSVYRITDMETWCLENGENVYLEYVSGEDTGYYGLVRSYSDNYYTPLLKDDVIDVVTLYTGSLYFSKDCIITVNDPGNAFRDHVVAIEDYFYSDAVGSQFGWFSGGLVLWGEFESDSSGLIISYTEEFLS